MSVSRRAELTLPCPLPTTTTTTTLEIRTTTTPNDGSDTVPPPSPNDGSATVPPSSPNDGSATVPPSSPWHDWGQWSACTKPKCDYGYQERMRTCELCDSRKDLERKLCNTFNCRGDFIDF